MKKKTKKAKVVKKNPQDSTRRNVQAANKKFAKLEARVEALEVNYKILGYRVYELQYGIKKPIKKTGAK